MSKAPNPTRPHASSTEVEERLTKLSSPHRRRLEELGYPIEDLRRIAEVEKQADAVDALLAIMTDRHGYVHDQRDVAMAERVARTLDAKFNPRSHLVWQNKEKPVQDTGFHSGANAGDPGSWKTVALVFLTVLVALFVIAALITTFK